MAGAVLNPLRFARLSLRRLRNDGLTAAQIRRELDGDAHRNRNERIGNLILKTVDGLEIRKVLEIGGRRNPFKAIFDDGVDYLNMDPFFKGPNTITADITDCPDLAGEQFDLILSSDVFEHINAPWKAGAEITRLLRPGGITFHSTLFAWRYHPCPQDYFRFTPKGLQQLFPDLDCLLATFDPSERRRNILGRGKSKLTPDAFGGWRENWRVHYAGRKPGG